MDLLHELKVIGMKGRKSDGVRETIWITESPVPVGEYIVWQQLTTGDKNHERFWLALSLNQAHEIMGMLWTKHNEKEQQWNQ